MDKKKSKSKSTPAPIPEWEFLYYFFKTMEKFSSSAPDKSETLVTPNGNFIQESTVKKIEKTLLIVDPMGKITKLLKPIVEEDGRGFATQCILNSFNEGYHGDPYNNNVHNGL